ncbi:MAG: nucleotidyltransferase [Sedimentisphaerales bacterium]|nr:nucleotidyltransferase [Sedimentisphaerales bacterium]
MILLEDAYKKVVTFLNKERYKYIIIGGIAAGTLGEPRVTGDVDIDIEMESSDITAFLDKAEKEGFKFTSKQCLTNAEHTGTFQINYEAFHIDFIIASTDFEKAAFERKKIIKLYGIKAFFPTPEDLILLKIIPGRDKDLLDAKNIVLRHKNKLDTKYLKNWVSKLCDEARDMRMWNILINLLED